MGNRPFPAEEIEFCNLLIANFDSIFARTIVLDFFKVFHASMQL